MKTAIKALPFPFQNRHMNENNVADFQYTVDLCLRVDSNIDNDPYLILIDMVVAALLSVEGLSEAYKIVARSMWNSKFGSTVMDEVLEELWEKEKQKEEEQDEGIEEGHEDAVRSQSDTASREGTPIVDI